jgi:phosphoglycolate phosphatase
LTKAVIFDVDGTLVTLNVDGDKLRTTMAMELDKLGFDISFMDGGGYTQEIIDQAKLQVDLGTVKADFEGVKLVLYRALDALEMQWNAQSVPIPGVVETLTLLRRRGLVLATLTNSGRAPSDWLLKKHDLLRYFDHTFTRDDVPFMKPRPESLTFAVSEMGVEKEDVLFVGDSVVDVRAARAAGVRMASITSGRYSAERLRGEGSDLIVESLAEVVDLV